MSDNILSADAGAPITEDKPVLSDPPPVVQPALTQCPHCGRTNQIMPQWTQYYCVHCDELVEIPAT
jgi:hypothetical protein